MMMRSPVLAMILCGVLAAADVSGPTVAQQLVELPPDSIVEVRLNDKRKLRGRLGALDTDAFEVQVAGQTGVAKERLRYADVKSVKPVSKMGAGRSAGFVALGALAAVGATVLVIIAIYFSGAD